MKLLTLSEIQQLQIEMISEIDSICRENNIEYAFMYGSMLGMVRHSGFIPWDDDIDIVLSRENYEKLLNVLLNKDINNRFIQNNKTDKYFEFPIIRYCAKNTFCYSSERQKLKSKKYIYIDIFPLDNLPDDDELAKQHIKKVSKLRKIIYHKMNYRWCNKTKLGYLRCYLYKFIYCFSSIRKLVNKLEIEMTRYSFMSSKRLINFNTAYNYNVDTFNRDELFPSKEFSFDGKMFFGVNDYEKILRQLYNDYLILPPEEKRKQRHDCYLIEEGDKDYER